MITLQEAKDYRYEQWVGKPKGTPYNKKQCAREVINGYIYYQCSRKNGHGIENLFCKQHAKGPNVI